MQDAFLSKCVSFLSTQLLLQWQLLMLYFSTSIDQKKKKQQQPKKPNNQKLKYSIKPYRKNSKKNGIGLNSLQRFILVNNLPDIRFALLRGTGSIHLFNQQVFMKCLHVYDIREPKNISSTSTSTLVSFYSTFRIQ